MCLLPLCIIGAQLPLCFRLVMMPCQMLCSKQQPPVYQSSPPHVHADSLIYFTTSPVSGSHQAHLPNRSKKLWEMLFPSSILRYGLLTPGSIASTFKSR